jgi:hypothetical protein
MIGSESGSKFMDVDSASMNMVALDIYDITEAMSLS